MRTAIKNITIFDGRNSIRNKCLLINGAFTEGIIEEKDIPSSCAVIDGETNTVAPAFIDLQVNGGGGKLFTECPTIDTLRVMANAHKKFGVLYTMPTLISTDLETILKAIQAVKAAQEEDLGIIGLHLEGPFLLDKKAGIHERKYIRNCTLAEIHKIVNGNEKAIVQITLAPEACSDDCLKCMLDHGIRVFIGHSNASYKQCCEFFEQGVIGVTHLYNAMSQLGSREPGMVGASFLTKTWAGIIVDGFHVDFSSVEIAKRMKEEKLYLVTDAMPPVGVGDMDFQIGATEIHCRDNKCLSNDGTIAGSALNMNKALQNLVHYCGIPLEEALRMTSTYQAKMLGIDSECGCIASGIKANFVILNHKQDVISVVKNGKIEEMS